MKKLLITLLSIVLISQVAYGAMTWTKLWSSADDDSTYSGSDIGTMQDDIADQVATTAGDNALTGANTFAGATTFTGNVSGISSAKDSITRGFELVWGSIDQVIVNVGTLYHGTTQVDKTSNVHLDVTTASDYITGVSEQATDDWLYVYSDSSGNFKLDNNEPDKSDASGDTEGVFLYYYYAAGATYHRCVGAIRLNATGSGQVDKFYQRRSRIGINGVDLSAGVSNGVWSVPLDCSSAIPSIATTGIFRVNCTRTTNPTGTDLRPSIIGVNWAADATVGFAGYDNSAGGVQGTLTCPTNSSQEIQHNDYNPSAITIYCIGYHVDIR